MIYGLDTGFLVAAELREHPQHAAAIGTLTRLIRGGDLIGIAPQVLAEFIHIVTDAATATKALAELELHPTRHHKNSLATLRSGPPSTVPRQKPYG